MTVRFRPEAQAELLEAARWYEDRESGLGQSLIAEIDATLARIEGGEHRYRNVYRQMRRALVRKFPYAVYFIEADDGLVVMGVIHQRRDTTIVYSRLDDSD